MLPSSVSCSGDPPHVRFMSCRSLFDGGDDLMHTVGTLDRLQEVLCFDVVVPSFALLAPT
jgi:hypothetical protein